ncbi:MAG: hypothetical protein JXB13_03185 [Phycisphaerae bacterium]|nr:hypothetical protein [Phycisphaerae bacterium]
MAPRLVRSPWVCPKCGSHVVPGVTLMNAVLALPFSLACIAVFLTTGRQGVVQMAAREYDMGLHLLASAVVTGLLGIGIIAWLWMGRRTRVFRPSWRKDLDGGANDDFPAIQVPYAVPGSVDDSSGVRLVVSRHTRLARASFLQYWQMELGCAVVLTLHALALLPVWTGLVVLVACWIVAGLYRNLATRVHLAKTRVPEGPVVGGSLRRACYGNPDELETIAQTPREPFEPVVVQVSTYDCLPGWLFVPAILAVGIGTYFLPGIGGSVVTAAAIALAVHVLGRLAGQIAWPTYYRVVPGRLEVLRYSPFRRAPVLSRTLLLRDAMIVCDLRQRYLMVLDHVDAPQGLHFNLWRVPDPLAFAQAVFRGATVAADAPALPEDELLG